jgi:hypothetical protein
MAELVLIKFEVETPNLGAIMMKVLTSGTDAPASGSPHAQDGHALQTAVA